MAELLYPLDEGGDELTLGWRPEDYVGRSDELQLSYVQVESQWHRIRQCLVEDRFHIQLGDPVDGDSSRRKNREFLYSFGLGRKSTKEVSFLGWRRRTSVMLSVEMTGPCITCSALMRSFTKSLALLAE